MKKVFALLAITSLMVACGDDAGKAAETKVDSITAPVTNAVDSMGAKVDSMGAKVDSVVAK
jgi:hypothetical protein